MLYVARGRWRVAGGRGQGVGGWMLDGLPGGGRGWQRSLVRFTSTRLCIVFFSFLFSLFSFSHFLMFHISYSQKYIKNESYGFPREDV
jgi:hypothetical protein